MMPNTQSPENGFRRRNAATWAMIAASAAGAAGACVLAYSTTKVDDAATAPDGVTYEGAPPTGFLEGTGNPRATTTTSPPPGINGAPLKSGSGSHTKSHGS